MWHNQSWKNDFLSTTTAESPMPFRIWTPPPEPGVGTSNIITLMGVGS